MSQEELAEWELELLRAYGDITDEELEEAIAEIHHEEDREHEELMNREVW